MPFSIDNPIAIILLSLSVAMIVEILLPIPADYHPLTIFRIAAFNLGLKVNPQQNRARSQRYIAGLLAPIIFAGPLILILLIGETMVVVSELFDFVLLVLALSYQPIVKNIKSIRSALTSNQNTLAKELLQPMVLRETASLSAMGICKATIETAILRLGHQYLTVIFVYLVAGSVAAVAYRMCFEMAQQWNQKNTHNREFAAFVSVVTAIVSLFPSFILVFLLSFMGSIKNSVKLYSQAAGNWPVATRAIICASSASLKVNLGGPLMIEKEKIKRPRITINRDPQASDLAALLTTINWIRGFFLVLFSGIATALVVLG